jgi:hypothetical protein
MTRAEACRFADEWIDAWNALDVERVLSRFADDAAFTSPKALETVGSATVRGKAAMREYWTKRVGTIRSLRFTLDRALFDPSSRELGIVYEAALDGRRVRACEFLRLGEDGRAVAGEAMYGAPM